jgi:hypothetical protein
MAELAPQRATLPGGPSEQSAGLVPITQITLYEVVDQLMPLRARRRLVAETDPAAYRGPDVEVDLTPLSVDREYGEYRLRIFRCIGHPDPFEVAADS